MPFPLRRFFAEVRATLHASIGTFADALRSAALNIVLRIMASTSAARQLRPRPSMPPLTAEPFHEKLLYGAVGTDRFALHDDLRIVHHIERHARIARYHGLENIICVLRVRAGDSEYEEVRIRDGLCPYAAVYIAHAQLVSHKLRS